MGGIVGGRLPDIVEPATSPRHRSTAHSWLVLFIVAAVSLEAARRQCREQARSCEQRLSSLWLSPEQRVLFALLSVLWRISSGFCTGVQVGYVSHLVLDGCTPSGLPIFVR